MEILISIVLVLVGIFFILKKIKKTQDIKKWKKSILNIPYNDGRVGLEKYFRDICKFPEFRNKNGQGCRYPGKNYTWTVEHDNVLAEEDTGVVAYFTVKVSVPPSEGPWATYIEQLLEIPVVDWPKAVELIHEKIKDTHQLLLVERVKEWKNKQQEE